MALLRLGRTGAVRQDAETGELLDGDVSVDWFRVPSGYAPEGADITPESWLELNFACDQPKGSGNRWLRLEGRIHCMEFRGEVTNMPKLIRVLDPG